MSIVRIFNEEESEAEENTTWSIEDVKDYVNQFMVYEQQIKDLQDSRREWSADFLKRKSIPKKELTQALRVARQELDMDVVNEIYDNIVDLFVD
jgi:hypothetical protein